MNSGEIGIFENGWKRGPRRSLNDDLMGPLVNFYERQPPIKGRDEMRGKTAKGQDPWPGGEERGNRVRIKGI